MDLGLIIVLGCLGLLAIGAVLYEMYFKSGFERIDQVFPDIIHKEPEPINQEKPEQVELTKEQCAKLFDEVLPIYFARSNPGNIVVGINIGGVGSWVIDNKNLTIQRMDKPPALVISITNVGVLNELINDNDITVMDMLRLKMNGSVNVKGDYNKLTEFKSFIHMIQDNREEIYKRL